MKRALTNEGVPQPAFVPINLEHLPFFLSPSITYFFISGRAQLLLTCCTRLSSPTPFLRDARGCSGWKCTTKTHMEHADMQTCKCCCGFTGDTGKTENPCPALLSSLQNPVYSFLLRDPTKTWRAFVWSQIHFLRRISADFADLICPIS